MKTKHVPLFLLLFIIGCTKTTEDTHTANLMAILNQNPLSTFTKSNDPLISLLPKMPATKLDCSASVYWEIVAKGETYIPQLIEALTDTTLTNINRDCNDGKLSISDLSYFALEEIIELPHSIIFLQNCTPDLNTCHTSSYNKLFIPERKHEIQADVAVFVAKYENDMQFSAYEGKEQSQKCYKRYGITGRFFVPDDAFHQPTIDSSRFFISLESLNL